MTLEKLITAEETANLIGVKRATLDIWASTGRYDLEFVRVGRRRLYRPSAVEAFLVSRTATKTGA